MSGRARHLRIGRDGAPELVTNRKTDARQAPRIPRHEMPEWCVTVSLPGTLAFAVSEGQTGVLAVSVTRDSVGRLQLEARGKDCEWLFGQIVKFLSVIQNGWQGRMHLRAQRGAYPGCTDGAPMRSAVDRAQDVYLVLEPTFVIPRGVREPLMLAVKP